MIRSRFEPEVINSEIWPGVCPAVSMATMPGATSSPGLMRVVRASIVLKTRLAPAAIPSTGPVSFAASPKVQKSNSLDATTY